MAVNEQAPHPPIIPKAPYEADQPPRGIGVIPPEPRSRAIVWGSLLFLGLILIFATTTSAIASSGVLGVVIIITFIAVTLVICGGAGARQPARPQVDPEHINVVGDRPGRTLR